MQIGIKPEIIIEWGYESSPYDGKFDIIPVLNKSKLQTFNVNRYNMKWAKKIDFGRIESLKHIDSSMLHSIYDKIVIILFDILCIIIIVSHGHAQLNNTIKPQTI